VQKSLDQLAGLMPGRYAKSEISSGFVGSIQTYAYRVPIIPRTGPENLKLAERPAADGQSQPEEAMVDVDGESW
jgi:hypothetical protein